MPAGASARRYAQAAFEIAVERDDTEGWLADLTLLASTVANEDQLRQVLSAPRIQLEQKEKVIQEAFGFLPVQRRRMAAFWTDERRGEYAEKSSKDFWTDDLLEEYRKINRGDYSVGVLGINLMLLLTRRNHVYLLPSIADRFEELLDAHKGVVSAQVVSAVALDDEQADRIKRALAEMSDTDVHLINLGRHTDPEILGGMIIRIGDRVLDGSARTRLRNMRRELAQRR